MRKKRLNNMKCTRFHYMKCVDDFLSKEQYNNDSALEISGQTQEWLKFFKTHTVADYKQPIVNERAPI